MPRRTASDSDGAPAHATGWPARRTPRWILLSAVPLIVVAVAVSLVHKPSQAERASDLRGYLQELTTDIESCAGGVSESLSALRIVQAQHERDPANVTDAISVAQQGAANCAPAENEQIDDLENYQAPESLDGFGLVGAVTGLVNWAAPDAEDVQTDVADVLSAQTPQATRQAEAALSRAITALNAQRAAVNGPIEKAITSLAMHTQPLRLPG
jgi:hypothetical protein